MSPVDSLFPAMTRPLLFLCFLGACGACFADGCPTGTPIATVNLTVMPPKDGSALPLNVVNVVSAGDKLHYEPVKLPDDLKRNARVSMIIVPADDREARHFRVLDAQPVGKPAEWPVSQTVSAVGLIFGSYGIDTKKIASLVQKHPEIITKLADYAEQSTRVEALVQTLSEYEKSPPAGKSLQSVLQGFSSQYGVKLPALDSKTASSEQALSMLNAIAPAVSTPDPLPSHSQMMVKAGGLAESVAVSYFGAPVALTVSGAALFQSLHSSLFPPTNVRSAFAQPADKGGTNLCSAKKDEKGAHIDYIWISRIPNQEPPALSLAGDPHLPAGMPSRIAVSAATVVQAESLSRARNWELVSGANAFPIPAQVTAGSPNDTIQLDLAKAKVGPGRYQLAADWDWTPIKVKGDIEIDALGEVSKVRPTSESRDALVSGRGPLRVQLTGTDFEFVESVSLVTPAKPAKTIPLEFTLPQGKQAGIQQQMQVEIDTAGLSPGPYALAITQVNKTTSPVPLVIHPPNPELAQLPLRLNVNERQQEIVIHGKHLERIEKITSGRAQWVLAAVPEGAVDMIDRPVSVSLASTAQKGDRLNAEVFVSGLDNPIRLDGIARVAGPRPRITKATKAFAAGSGVELRDGEIPSGMAVGFSLQAQNAGSHPVLKLSCASDSETRRRVSLSPGDKADSAQLDLTGAGSLFLSVDPGVVGDSGCTLTADLTEKETGTSDPFVLGQVIRLPQIRSFVITEEKLGDSSYVASLTGRDLQVIETTGWGAAPGEPVQGIPTPVPADPQEQTLRIAVPWPPPAPRAPLYISLRGENQARKTETRY